MARRMTPEGENLLPCETDWCATQWEGHPAQRSFSLLAGNQQGIFRFFGASITLKLPRFARISAISQRNSLRSEQGIRRR